MMKQNWLELLASVDSFYKAAGTLKVPEKLLEEVFDFIRTCYCKQVANFMRQKIVTAQNRNKIQDKIFILNDNWDKAYNLILGITDDYKQLQYKYNETVTEDLLVQELNKLVSFCSKNELTIPTFNMRATDAGNWTGVINKGSSVFFRFEKSSKSTYRLDYFVSIGSRGYDENYEGQADSDAQSYHVEVSKSNLTPLEAGKILLDIMNNDKIYIPFKYLSYLKNYWDTLDERYFRHLQTVYGYCLKLSQEGDSESKIFRLDQKDFPYDIKFLPNREFEFTAKFVTEAETTKIYDKEPWAGLWSSPGNPSHRLENTKRVWNLGTLYVARDTEADAKKLDNLEDLNTKLNELQRTTRHELQHFMQNLLGWITKKPNQLLRDITWKGMPSKNIRTPGYDVHGNPLDNPNQRIDHALRDVEFYTRLSDCIDNFNRSKQTIPTIMHKEYAKAWLGIITRQEFRQIAKAQLKTYIKNTKGVAPDDTSIDWGVDREVSFRMYNIDRAIDLIYNSFFEKLKESQPEKYRKAATEFLKGINL